MTAIALFYRLNLERRGGKREGEEEIQYLHCRHEDQKRVLQKGARAIQKKRKEGGGVAPFSISAPRNLPKKEDSKGRLLIGKGGRRKRRKVSLDARGGCPRV